MMSSWAFLVCGLPRLPFHVSLLSPHRSISQSLHSTFVHLSFPNCCVGGGVAVSALFCVYRSHPMSSLLGGWFWALGCVAVVVAIVMFGWHQ